MIKQRGRPPGTFKHIHPARINGKATKAYSAWQAMQQRCYNRNTEHFKNYGGRGITVCDRWLGRGGYDNFVCDLGVPLPGFWIERRDNDKGYSPDNCYWATPKEQANNRRKGGPPVKPDSLRQRALRAGLSYHLVYLRVHVNGWTVEDALSTPKLGIGQRRV